MDGIVAAVHLMADQQALVRLQAVTGMVKAAQKQEMALLDLIVDQASSGTLYSGKGALAASSSVGAKLDARA
jgi:hypothetical protein